MKGIYRKYVPLSIRIGIDRVRSKRRDRIVLKEINHFFEGHPEEYQRYRVELNFLNRSKSVEMLPYPFVFESERSKIAVHEDAATGFPYVLHRERRLYFPSKATSNLVQKMYSGLLLEQHAMSPHRYFSDAFFPMGADTLLDIGAAEGLISLEWVERVRAVILFEPDPIWREPLTLTFEPWKDKVTLIPKAASSLDNDLCQTVDSVLREHHGPILLKIDVEGAEAVVLKGAEKTLQKPETRVVCCVYHRKEDAGDFERFFSERGYRTEITDGFILPSVKEMQSPPYFRRGVIRAWKPYQNEERTDHIERDEK